jgi:hypothetical protein
MPPVAPRRLRAPKPPATPGGTKIAAAGAVVAIAATVIGMVVGLLTYLRPPVAPNPAQQSPDDRLELVSMVPAAKPYDAPVLGDVDGGGQAPPRQSTGETRKRRSLQITLRNQTDNPAVLTAIRVVVKSSYTAELCGYGSGGGIDSSLDYQFRFDSEGRLPWSHTEPQQFQVAPHAVDALTVTIGPLRDAFPHYLWKFSVSGLLKDGREVPWGEAIWSDYYELKEDVYRDLILGRSPPPEAARSACAKRAEAGLRKYIAGDGIVLHPGIRDLLACYQELAGK